MVYIVMATGHFADRSAIDLQVPRRLLLQTFIDSRTELVEDSLGDVQPVQIGTRQVSLSPRSHSRVLW